MGQNEKKDDMDDHEKPLPPAGSIFCSSRFSIAIVGFLGFVNLYALRVNMSVAIVCMINQTALDIKNPPSNNTPPEDDSGCLNLLGNDTKADKDGEFDWDKETQGIILGAFFWGYLLTQIPGGWLAERIGGKGVFGWFMLLCAVATLLTPVGAAASPYVLVFLRIVKGIGQGVVFPAMHAIWSRWAPPLERSILIGFTYAGAQIGNVITFPIAAVLCDGVGWEAIFYVFGGFGVAWFVAWMIVASNSPAHHRWIKPEERKYIEAAIGASRVREQQIRKELGTPWMRILTSPAVWAIVVAHTCANWGTYTLLTNIPAYMKEVLKFDIKSNGLFSAIPYVCFWLMINVAGWVADILRRRGWQTALVRKLAYTCGTIGPGVFLIGTGFITCSTPYAAVAVLAFAVGLSGCQYAGVMVNHVDIAPPFSGILFGLSNTFATLPGILAPYAIGVITVDQTQAQWQIVFYISAAIYAFGCVFFWVFARGEVQDWARPYMFDEEDADKKVPLAVEQVEAVDGEMVGVEKEAVDVQVLQPDGEKNNAYINSGQSITKL